MTKIASLLIKLFGIILISLIISIGSFWLALYVSTDSHEFDSRSLASAIIFLIGVIVPIVASAILSGYYVYKAAISMSPVIRYVVVSFSGVVVAVLVILSYAFILLTWQHL
ncbi:MAG: hypothetical protein FWD70_05895 [Desulfuromonadales bacterium]|nr:hypothetical protein [Desulfuromonadales bacterium]